MSYKVAKCYFKHVESMQLRKRCKIKRIKQTYKNTWEIPQKLVLHLTRMFKFMSEQKKITRIAHNVGWGIPTYIIRVNHIFFPYFLVFARKSNKHYHNVNVYERIFHALSLKAVPRFQSNYEIHHEMPSRHSFAGNTSYITIYQNAEVFWEYFAHATAVHTWNVSVAALYLPVKPVSLVAVKHIAVQCLCNESLNIMFASKYLSVRFT